MPSYIKWHMSSVAQSLFLWWFYESRTPCSGVSLLPSIWLSSVLHLFNWSFQVPWSWTLPFLPSWQTMAVPPWRPRAQLWASMTVPGAGSLVNVWGTLRLQREIDLWWIVITGLSLSLPSMPHLFLLAVPLLEILQDVTSTPGMALCSSYDLVMHADARNNPRHQWSWVIHFYIKLKEFRHSLKISKNV